MALQHRLGADADLVDHAGPEVLDQDVRRRAKTMQLLDVVGRLEVEQTERLLRFWLWK